MRGSKIKWLASFVMSAIFCRTVTAGEYFDPGLLQSVNGEATLSDTSLLSQGYQPAGTYRVHINVNDKPVMISSVRFEQGKDKQLVACLSFKAYQKLGVDMSKVSSKAEDNDVKNTCVSMEEQVPGTKVAFDFSKLQLDITIPQTVLRDESSQGVPEEEWDDGIPALINNYQLSGQQYLKDRQGNASSVYANLTNGLNVGAWRYRNNSTLSNSEGWHSITNYVETAVHALKSELTIGDSSTPGDVFDSLLVRGVQLASDDDMLPDQLNGFAPIIRGIAKSNARVTVRENGYVVYQRSVPPGPFVINDLSSVSDGGKLDVIVTEADGSETHNTISYSSVPQLLRTGQIKYNLSVGRYLSGTGSVEDKPEILQAVISRGLPLNTTLYGGAQYHDRYNALSLGLGVDLKRLGGIAADITQSKGRRGDTQEGSGKMVRLTYRNYLTETDTQIQLDNRYYSGDYLSFSDWATAEDLFDDTRKRREYNLTVNQSLNESNSFYTTLSRSENVDRSVSRMWQIGWNGSVKNVSLSLAYSMTRSEGEAEWDKQLALTLSMPFSEAFPTMQPMVNYTATSGLQGDINNQLGINGKVGDHQNMTWNSQLSYAAKNGEQSTKSGSAGLDYQGNYGDMNVTYNADQSNYISWNASGSVVAHRHGVTFGRNSSNSLALVSIPGGVDVPLNGGQDVHTDSRGYALVTDLRPYHRNSLSIDTHEASKDLDFSSTSTELVPTKDAIVLAEFTAIRGRKAVITIKHNGDVLPFGAKARIEGMDNVYYVGDKGQVYLNAVPDKGTLTFKWGDDQTCSTPFEMPVDQKPALPILLLTLNCQ
ncbi:fimbria/pilus outer membrane usher protein [Cronobacter malonaticus]|uniref:fimbria/pilus outer membrane usher protein n=1 Tax=Cronobacter malonaticus TaxID=413503 RepID=UPI000CFC10B1|nr:fimbria/pilus outer membrane usher protein [Cronobacter malonaticus]MDT3537744.1 fimbria/pilus outer membrane usher protein [Cronobacter malonaticus]